MGCGRWLRVALSTTILLLLGCGVVTLGFSKAGHTVVGQHMAAETVGGAATADATHHAGVALDRHESPAQHRRAHPEHGLHLLGACATILAASLAILRGTCLGEGHGVGSRLLDPGPSSWSTVSAPRGLGPPVRTALCVQLC